MIGGKPLFLSVLLSTTIVSAIGLCGVAEAISIKNSSNKINKYQNNYLTQIKPADLPVLAQAIATDDRSKPEEENPAINNFPPTDIPNEPLPETEPEADQVHLVVRLSKRRVYVYRGDKVINRYPIAIGKKGWETPIGEFRVFSMEKNPVFKSFKTGRMIQPGPENPLGPRWIGIWTDGKTQLGFHGTNQPNLIGQAVSHGCLRMHNKHAIALYEQVRIGTLVLVKP